MTALLSCPTQVTGTLGPKGLTLNSDLRVSPKKRNPRKQEQKPPQSPIMSEMTLIHTSYRAWGEWVPQSSFLNLEIPREE